MCYLIGILLAVVFVIALPSLVIFTLVGSVFVWIADHFLAICVFIIVVFVGLPILFARFPKSPNQPPPSSKSRRRGPKIMKADYRRWTKKDWNAWKRSLANKRERPADLNLWTEEEKKDWEISEWLRLLEEDRKN
jgi:hypothetical protein